MTLDQWFQMQPKPQQPTTSVETKCARCGFAISDTEPKYTLAIKGKQGVYHQACAKQILKPQENTEENL